VEIQSMPSASIPERVAGVGIVGEQQGPPRHVATGKLKLSRLVLVPMIAIVDEQPNPPLSHLGLEPFKRVSDDESQVGSKLVRKQPTDVEPDVECQELAGIAFTSIAGECAKQDR
jgi:hypothetical protein